MINNWKNKANPASICAHLDIHCTVDYNIISSFTADKRLQRDTIRTITVSSFFIDESRDFSRICKFVLSRTIHCIDLLGHYLMR